MSAPLRPEIATYIFLDLETTGLPGRERADTRVVELCAVAAPVGALRRVRTLCFLLDPQRALDPFVARLIGLSDAELCGADTFPLRFEELREFIKAQPAPRCLLAHNGYAFDYRILLAECRAARRRLPRDLLCLDTLLAFRQLDKPRDPSPVPPLANLSNIMGRSPGVGQDSNVTSDDDEWPDLNLSDENWQEIDDICQRLSDVSTDSDSPQKPKVAPVTKNTIFNPQDPKSLEIEKIFSPKTHPVSKVISARQSYKLVDLYERLVGKGAVGAHRAEADCMMLLECVIATKDKFLPWANNNCRLLSDIKPIPKYNPKARSK